MPSCCSWNLKMLHSFKCVVWGSVHKDFHHIHLNVYYTCEVKGTTSTFSRTYTNVFIIQHILFWPLLCFSIHLCSTAHFYFNRRSKMNSHLGFSLMAIFSKQEMSHKSWSCSRWGTRRWKATCTATVSHALQPQSCAVLTYALFIFPCISVTVNTMTPHRRSLCSITSHSASACAGLQTSASFISTWS